MAWIDGLLPAILFVLWTVVSVAIMMAQVIVERIEKNKETYRRTHPETKE